MNWHTIGVKYSLRTERREMLILIFMSDNNPIFLFNNMKSSLAHAQLFSQTICAFLFHTIKRFIYFFSSKGVSSIQ